MINKEDLKVFGLSLALFASLPFQIIYLIVMLFPTLIKLLYRAVDSYMNS